MEMHGQPMQLYGGMRHEDEMERGGARRENDNGKKDSSHGESVRAPIWDLEGRPYR